MSAPGASLLWIVQVAQHDVPAVGAQGPDSAAVIDTPAAGVARNGTGRGADQSRPGHVEIL